MQDNKTNFFLLSIIVLGLLSLTSSCQKADVILNASVTSQIIDLPLEPLNADELTSLQLMREEEKLARDVYTTLYAKWGINVFTNISSSEQQHTDAVLTLLNKYGRKNSLLKSDNQDIKLVYDLLSMGSRNHMRTFYGQIISLVGSYSAQFITQSELIAIVTTPRETGNSW